jgi:hypothetical protein
VKPQHLLSLFSGLVALPGACAPAAQLKLAPDPLFQPTQVVRLHRGVLQGRVRPLWSLGGQFHAHVRLRRIQSDSIIATTVTDSKGSFRFGGIPVGTYRLAVLAIGYGRAEYTIAASDSGASGVVMGMKPDPFALEEICAGTCPPQPSGVITGSIRCAGPAGLVPPELELALTDSVSRNLRAFASVGESGHFEFTGIPLGAWRIEVSQRAKDLSVLHVRLQRDTLTTEDVRLTCR